MKTPSELVIEERKDLYSNLEKITADAIERGEITSTGGKIGIDKQQYTEFLNQRNFLDIYFAKHGWDCVFVTVMELKTWTPIAYKLSLKPIEQLYLK